MKSKILSIVFCLISTLLLSQNLKGSFQIDLKKNRDIFQIVNDSLKEVSFFISDRNKVRYYLMDEKFIFKDTISSKRTEKKFKDILGYSGSESKPIIYWSSKDKENICAQSFDLQNRKVTIKEFNINLFENSEVYLQTFSENNKFFILTIKSYSNKLMLYVFENDKFEKKEVNLESFRLYKSNTEVEDIYNILDTPVGGLNVFEKSLKLTKINPESLTSLTESAKKRKCYSNKNGIFITLDFNDSITQLITIDLNTFKPELINISKPTINNASINDTKSNSFIIDNKLILLTLNEKTLNLSIKDFKNNLIKEFVIYENEEFSIKNSAFVRQNIIGSERELTSTNQFLRKIVRSNIGISAYKLNGNYVITIGCVSPENNSGGLMGMGMPMGMPMIGFASGVMNFMQPINYFGLGFYNYQNRRTISTNCLLNDKFTHLDSAIEPLAFDKIQEFRGLNINIESETIFKMRDEYYLGYYDFNLTKYNFLIFTE